MYRAFIHDGKVTDRIDYYEDERFIAPDSVALAEVAAALGSAPSAVTAIRSGLKPSVEKVIPPQISLPETKSKADRLIDALATATTLAEIRAAAVALKNG